MTIKIGSGITIGGGITMDAGVGKVDAYGGNISTYTNGGTTYRVHTFNSSGTFTVTWPGANGLIEYVVVAGGGQGGGNGVDLSSPYGEEAGGGGAGGQVIVGNVSVTPNAYSIVVGAGGYNSTVNINGFSGDNSSAFGTTAIAGVGGSKYNTNGQNGAWAAGGGGSAFGIGGTGTYAGGDGSYGGGSPQTYGGGGGAGTTGDGQDANIIGSGPYGGIGGTGYALTNFASTGTVYYGGGGGGGRGGLGTNGGGNGAASGFDGGNATTAGGGGGGSASSIGTPSSQIGGAGANGIVIIRYPIS